MAELTFEAVRGTLLDHLKWLSAYVADPRVRRHMDAVEACLRLAGQTRLTQEVNADLRRRLTEAETAAARAAAVPAMLSYCKGHGCLGYEYLRRLAEAQPETACGAEPARPSRRV